MRGAVNHHGSDYIRSNEATLNSYWYPHIARLPVTATVTAVTPPDWIALGQGELVKTSRDADRVQTVTYRNDIPVCYYTLDMGRYIVTTRQAEGRTLSAYLLSRDSSRANRALDQLQKLSPFMSRLSARFRTRVIA